jgi:hypothetical protein
MLVITKEMKYRSRLDVFKFYGIGDIHIGAVNCAEDELRKKIKEIGSEPKSYIVGVGDWADSITKNDKRFDMKGLASWVERDNIIESQRKRLREIFEPVKDRIIVICTGNHEETIRLNHQDNLIRNLCDDLGVPYGGYDCYVLLRFERMSGDRFSFDLHVWHGSGGAQTDGAIVSRATRLTNEFVADGYFIGHLHRKFAFPISRIRVKQGRIKNNECPVVMTGSWLKTYMQPHAGHEYDIPPSYGERAGYKPSEIGCPVLCIVPNKEDSYVIV